MGLIDQLLTLYRVDSQVRGLRTRVDNAERYLRVQDRQLDQIKTDQAESELHIRQKEATASNIETERDGYTERIVGTRHEAEEDDILTALCLELCSFVSAHLRYLLLG